MAREIERGTQRLASTQSVTRGRWLTGHAASVLGLALTSSAAIHLGRTWVLKPVLDAKDLSRSAGAHASAPYVRRNWG